MLSLEVEGAGLEDMVEMGCTVELMQEEWTCQALVRQASHMFFSHTRQLSLTLRGRLRDSNGIGCHDAESAGVGLASGLVPCIRS